MNKDATQAEQAQKQHEAKRRSALVRQSQALMPYRTPEELAEMVGRMRFMIPGGDKLTDQEIWGLSQAALIYGMDPLMGELFWIDGPSPGIRGLRRKGKDQLMGIYGENGKPNLDFRIINEIEIRAELGIPEGALAFECRGSVPAKKQAHAELAKSYAEAGAPWEDIKEMIGPPPVTIGYGYLTKEEMYEKECPEWWHECTDKTMNTQKRKIWKDGKNVWTECYALRERICPKCASSSWKEPSNYSHIQHAQKRAEAHFWKIECDLPFDIKPSGEGFRDLGEWDDVIEGSFKESEAIFMGHPVPASIKTPEEFAEWQRSIIELEEYNANPHNPDAIADDVDTLYGDGAGNKFRDQAKKESDRTNPASWSKEILDAVVEAELADNVFEAAGMLSHSAFDRNVVKTPALVYAKAYRAARDEGDDPKIAGEKGMAKYLEGLKKRREK